MADCSEPQGANDAAFPFVAGPLFADARNACANALVCLLEETQFRRWGSEDAATFFKLEQVFANWPDAAFDVPYPAASIIEAGPSVHAAHSLTPTIIEDSFEKFCPGTVLWKTAELEATFQIDYWTNDEATREAIALRLPSLFNPSEARAGVILLASDRYFGATVRATLQSGERLDNPSTVYAKERRLRTTVTCEVDMLHLREAVPFRPSVRMTVTDEGDPPANAA